MSDAIVAEGLGKQFHHLDPRRAKTLQELWARGFRRPVKGIRYWALKDITFRIQPGQVVGLVGRNGTGKSTLLRLLAGVIRPDLGSLGIHGRLSTLLDLSGFHPDLTGRENVLINGVIAGLTRAEVAARFDSIVAFAELADFIDDPFRSYSAGMQLRLAFAVSVGVLREADVMLIDEVLTVGDHRFQLKCIERMKEFRAAGCTILLASHDCSLVRTLCDRTLWLRGGRLVADGRPADVVDRYLRDEANDPRTEQAVPGALQAVGQ